MPYDIACKAVMVNISDIAAMAAKPCWLSLALTLPKFEQTWLERFSRGLHDSLRQFDIALIGGDTTHGPLSMTLTMFGLIAAGKAVRRSGAQPGDKIYVSGELGAAALAVRILARKEISKLEKQALLRKLQHPYPRVDLSEILQECASAAIDISDGLSADLNHICVASGVGACLNFAAIPVHPLVKKYQPKGAVDFAIVGGDDYELCFTVPMKKEAQLLGLLSKVGLNCYPIGVIEEKAGLRVMGENGETKDFIPRGYSHF